MVKLSGASISEKSKTSDWFCTNPAVFDKSLTTLIDSCKTAVSTPLKPGLSQQVFDKHPYAHMLFNTLWSSNFVKSTSNNIPRDMSIRLKGGAIRWSNYIGLTLSLLKIDDVFKAHKELMEIITPFAAPDGYIGRDPHGRQVTIAYNVFVFWDYGFYLDILKTIKAPPRADLTTKGLTTSTLAKNENTALPDDIKKIIAAFRKMTSARADVSMEDFEAKKSSSRPTMDTDVYNKFREFLQVCISSASILPLVF